MNDIYLIGGGGHQKVVVDTILNSALELQITGFFDDVPRDSSIDYIGNIDKVTEYSNVNFALCIGDNQIRYNCYKSIIGCTLPVIKHNLSYISDSVTVGDGSVIFAGGCIQPDSTLGVGCIVNTNANLDHDCNIGDFVHIAPGSTLCGGVTVGSRSLIGAGSVILPGITIGSDCIIGAGTTVVEDLAPGAKLVGCKGRFI